MEGVFGLLILRLGMGRLPCNSLLLAESQDNRVNLGHYAYLPEYIIFVILVVVSLQP